MENKVEQKKILAKAALDCLPSQIVLGVGSGTTVDYLIEELVNIKDRIITTVASSKRTRKKLIELGFEVIELNSVSQVDWYLDSADEINDQLQMIKGGGGELTGEKIVASVSKKFICLADETKRVKILGNFPLPIEVIPMARSSVARSIVGYGGFPVYREGVLTDYGNVILDVWNLKIIDPLKTEQIINNFSGVVTNGVFASRAADVLLTIDQGKVIEVRV